MSQFPNTEDANKSFREALSGYQIDRNRIKTIKQLIANKQPVPNEDIIWLCNRATEGIDESESNWYSHG